MGVRPSRGLAALVLLVLAVAAGAQETAPAPAVAPGGVAELVAADVISLIGWTLPIAVQTAGAPADVFAFRGAEAWQDDVVFYYPGSVYLFWYRGRVWQVRVDAKYTGSVLGLRVGDTRERVLQTVSRPYQEVEGSLVFFLPDASLVDLPEGTAKGAYPLRLRVFFQDDKLTDVYVYRGDF